jgi:hypothetical protein
MMKKRVKKKKKKKCCETDWEEEFKGELEENHADHEEESSLSDLSIQ